MQIQQELSGERITIRDYFNTDLPFAAGMWLDGENGRYLSDPTRDFADDVYRKALAEMENHPDGYYLLIEATSTGQPIGSCCMFPDKKKEVYDIGYCIHKKYWKQGYGTETLLLMKDWICRHGGQEITAEVAKENIASNVLLKKLGFAIKRESVFEKYKMNIQYESYVYCLVLKKKEKESCRYSD